MGRGVGGMGAGARSCMFAHTVDFLLAFAYDVKKPTSSVLFSFFKRVISRLTLSHRVHSGWFVLRDTVHTDST